MWEFCVTASNKNENVIQYIQDKVLNVLTECDGVHSFVKKENFCSLCVGAKKEKSSYLKKKLTKIICDAVCEKMKQNYLKENVSINVVDESLFQAFIKVYTYFDIEIEKAIAIRAIYFPNVLNIESFLEFKLRPLKQKWKEMCNLTNLNASLFVKSETFLDLLKFLIANLDYKHKCIIINFLNNKIYKIVGEERVFLCDFCGEDVVDVLTKIIELSPQKIVVLNLNNQRTLAVLQDLFVGRLEIAKN